MAFAVCTASDLALTQKREFGNKAPQCTKCTYA